MDFLDMVFDCVFHLPYERMGFAVGVGVFCFVPGNVGMNEYGYPPERKFFP